MERGIHGYVGAVVVEERYLALLVSRALYVLEIVVCVCGRVDEGQVVGWDAGCVLESCGFERQDAVADGFVVLRRRVGPERFDRVPEWVAESFDVGVAVLGYYRFDGGWVAESEAQTDGGSVVEDVYSVRVDVEGGEECAHCDG